VLFDDIDILLMEDEKFSTLNSAKQFLTQFVHEMQGINFKVQVLVIGVTSRIESLDITVRKCFEVRKRVRSINGDTNIAIERVSLR
jgi:SpoVK/Ycf46/Vps4 family AAA+-type ATPase